MNEVERINALKKLAVTMHKLGEFYLLQDDLSAAFNVSLAASLLDKTANELQSKLPPTEEGVVRLDDYRKN